MKKPVVLLFALVFTLALLISSLTWADREEGSGTNKNGSAAPGHSDEYKDKNHSSDQAGHKKEGSGAKHPEDKSADHTKKEEGSSADEKKKAPAPKREGS